ncbi:type IV pilin [Halobacteriales archaeon QH_7_69_31]|nr:MAG: type IV pilin [Halobacteriales archaeon QH_7_69_31]
MKLNELFADNDAVSPVIGVILMVAITVILAAVIGTFVLGLGSEIQSTTPQVDFTFQEQSNGNLDITHDGGDKVQAENLNVTGTGSSPITNCQSGGGGTNSWSTEISAGDTCTVTDSELDSGETVRVTWESDDGSQTGTLARYDYDQ